MELRNAEERLQHCTVVHGDVGESLLRLFLGAVTLGKTVADQIPGLIARNEAMARLHSFEPARIGLGDFGRGEERPCRARVALP